MKYILGYKYIYLDYNNNNYTENHSGLRETSERYMFYLSFFALVYY